MKVFEIRIIDIVDIIYCIFMMGIIVFKVYISIEVVEFLEIFSFVVYLLKFMVRMV